MELYRSVYTILLPSILLAIDTTAMVDFGNKKDVVGVYRTIPVYAHSTLCRLPV
jgi:hypothetical protein